MTVSATTNRVTFAGPYTVPLDFTLKCYETTDLVLVVSNDTTGAETSLDLGVHYTVSLDDPGPGGTITILDAADLPVGSTLTVLVTLPYTQAIDLTAGGNMPAEVLEEGYDRAILLIQQLKELLDRTPKLLKSSSFKDLSYPDPEAGKYLAWKTDLSGFTNMAYIPADGVLSLSTYGESVIAATDADTLQTLLEISAFVKTILNDADAPAVLTTLGITAFAKTFLDDANAAAVRTTLGVPAIGLPTNHISGLTVSHDTDTDHDIAIAAGKARDATDAADLVLAAALVKRIDATWAVGSTEGGMATGETIPTGGTVHLWLIKRSDTGVVDAMFNNHATTGLAPTLPAGYDYKRRIASFFTASSNIINGDQWGTGHRRRWTYDTPILDISSATPGTNAVTKALTVPAGIAVQALLNVVGTASFPYFSALDSADVAPSATLAPGISGYEGQVKVKTNAASQVRYRCLADQPIYGSVLGWEDSL